MNKFVARRLFVKLIRIFSHEGFRVQGIAHLAGHGGGKYRLQLKSKQLRCIIDSYEFEIAGPPSYAMQQPAAGAPAAPAARRGAQPAAADMAEEAGLLNYVFTSRPVGAIPRPFLLPAPRCSSGGERHK